MYQAQAAQDHTIGQIFLSDICWVNLLTNQHQILLLDLMNKHLKGQAIVRLDSKQGIEKSTNCPILYGKATILNDKIQRDFEQKGDFLG